MYAEQEIKKIVINMIEMIYIQCWNTKFILTSIDGKIKAF